jgi:hypothetical protein
MTEADVGVTVISNHRSLICYEDFTISPPKPQLLYIVKL